MKKLAILACLALLLVISAKALYRLRSIGVHPVQPANLIVTFTGFTNGALGNQALFYFTNATSRSVHFQVLSLDYRADSGWKPAPETQGNRLVGLLSSGKAFRWPVDVDATNIQWRLRISCVEQATGVPRVIDRGKEVMNRIETGGPTHIFTHRKYEVVSSEGERMALRATR